MKNIIKKTIPTILIGFAIWLNFIAVKSLFKDYDVINCGTVTSGIPKDRIGKYNVQREFYLGVQFDNGTFKALEVSPTTYLSKKEGDKVCFTDSTKPAWYIMLYTFLVCEAIFLLGWFFKWVYDIDLDKLL